jgi:hypothetical protein
MIKRTYACCEDSVNRSGMRAHAPLERAFDQTCVRMPSKAAMRGMSYGASGMTN